MSDPKPPGKNDPHAAASHAHDSFDFKKLYPYLKWVILFIFFVGFIVFILQLSSASYQLFLYGTFVLEFVCILVLIYQFYHLQKYRAEFLHWCHEIDHLYAEKNGQAKHGAHGHGGHDAVGHEEHEHVPTITELKLKKAKEHIYSKYPEESKTGLKELDVLLKNLLIQKKYVGETVSELLDDAKKKGYENASDALLAHKTKNYLIKMQSSENSQVKIFQQVYELYARVIQDLDNGHHS